MTETKESTTYAERMEEAFPDVNEELAKYSEEKQQALSAEQQKYWMRYFRMMRALQMHRTHGIRTISTGKPEPMRSDGTPYTKSPRATRIAANRKRTKIAKLSRAKNR